MDLNRRRVRITQVTASGFVEFEFSIADPQLSVELILPLAAFGEFCRANRVEQLDGRAGEGAWSAPGQDLLRLVK
jgi:phenol hydroxylase P0 protein